MCYYLNSFSDLIVLFEKTIRYNSKFPLEPENSITNTTGGFKASYDFWKFIKDKHPELDRKIVEVTEEYIIEKSPLPTITNEPLSIKTEPEVERMRLGWREIASKFGDP